MRSEQLTNDVVGAYSYSDDDGWRWTTTLQSLYGFDGRTLSALIDRVHPDDREPVRAQLENGARTGAPFGFVHRLADADDHRVVVLSGSTGPGGTGRRSYGGLAAELGGEVFAATSASAQEQLGRALRSHATVDRAKGALMLVYGLDEDRSFDLLRWNSMRVNSKLARLAADLVDALPHGASLMAETRDALLRELERPPLPRASEPIRAPSAGPSTVKALAGGPVPLVTVSGPTDLRVAHEIHAALEATWWAARQRGRLVVDTAEVVWACTAARRVLASAARRGARERVAFRVVVAPGDPLLLRRDLPAGTIARRPEPPVAAGRLPA